jgi:DNA mismatch repair protein MutS
MFKEYIELYTTYTQKYGKKTAIFLMVGSFYELYDIQDQQTGETQANVREIVDYLGIQLSHKKGEVGEGKDGLFAGFPDYAMHKWAGRLTSAGWTVIIVDQIKDSKGKVKERKVSRILSPSTHIENATSTDTPYVTTLFFQSHLVKAPDFGAATLDLTTGTTKTYSGTANGRPDIWTADDLVQLFSVYAPKEIIIYWQGECRPDEVTFRRIFGFSSSILLHLRSLDMIGAFSKELVRSEYLQLIYSIKSVLPIKTYLGLRSEQEELSLLYLLQFVEEHYPSMLKSFHRNEPWIPQSKLICGNHALTQLQMTSSNPAESVLGLFDKCITVMGKRAIKERILSPNSDPDMIRTRLNEVKDYMIWPEDVKKLLERQLRFMFDLPRLHRKVLCGLVTPSEIAGLFQTYSAMYVIMTQVTKNTMLMESFTQEEWYAYMHVFKTHFSEEKALTSNSDHTAFNSMTYKDIDLKEKEIEAVLQDFQQLRSTFSTKGGVQEDAIRLEEREKEPYGLKGSTITLQQLKKKIHSLPEGTKISELKSGGWIDCTLLQQLNTKLQKLREQLDHLVKIHLLHACLKISEAGATLWTVLEQWVCHVDGTQCIGRISKEYGFSCPRIESMDESGSGFEIKQVRHPLVEASASRVSYVKHDVSLDNHTKGWLVYGMNASGKSTLMKATGICILLAQAGCFVPAKEMILKPFQAIYTRILNQDNLFAGLSSFAVEMSELRDILRNANPYTLVLGDELCAGTESISAQALVTSGIQWLSAKQAKFIFATHLHGIPDLIDIKKEGVEIWHLHVEYDPLTKKLIYDRSLRPGNGSTLYGLEVARAMDLPFEFIEQAMKNRHQILGSTVQEAAIKTSWNKEVTKRMCEVCKHPITKDLEVHHLQHRASATNGILEDGSVMNDKRNLITICQTCHDSIHAGKMEVGQLVMTSDGPEREVVKVESDIKKKGKWTDEEMEIMKNTLQTYTSLSLKAIRAHLSSKHEIEISESMLGKIRRTF